MKELVAEIVAAYVSKNAITIDQLLALIATVSQSFVGLGQADLSPSPEPANPAVPRRRSVAPDAITCLDCGFKAKMLKRHLSSQHGMTVGEYRAKWSLGADYPMVAPNYAAKQSALAKSLRLGRRRSR
jgi:predicted transcriptional regulator